jgi:hypothetical protein
MQNDLLAILHWTLRILRLCRQQVWGVFVLPRGNLGRSEWLAMSRLGAMGFSADFDSARLDAVSRSVMWGAGALSPEPVPAPVRVPRRAAISAESRRGIQLRFHR